jgi:hypothetical protein
MQKGLMAVALHRQQEELVTCSGTDTEEEDTSDQEEDRRPWCKCNGRIVARGGEKT